MGLIKTPLKETFLSPFIFIDFGIDGCWLGSQSPMTESLIKDPCYSGISFLEACL